MSKLVLRSIAVLATLALSGAAFADNYVEVWTCTLEDDKKVEDVQTANSVWLAYVHKNISEDITSSVLTSVVGDSTGFVFVDSFPDLDTWARAKTRLDSDEADELEDLFEGIFECSENSLHKVTPTT